MSYLAVTQRVYGEPDHGMRLDALDQRWAAFLRFCGLTPLPVPNIGTEVTGYLDDLPLLGVLLTGGNDLAAYGGDAPERDSTEVTLVEESLRRRLPLLGVCRGMQLLQWHFGIELVPVTGHVTARQKVLIGTGHRVVNSYHRMAATTSRPPLLVWARAADGVVKAVSHETEKVMGIMWHPERVNPPPALDRNLFIRHFLGSATAGAWCG